jgi:hypothetical protein
MPRPRRRKHDATSTPSKALPRVLTREGKTISLEQLLDVLGSGPLALALQRYRGRRDSIAKRKSRRDS